MNDLVRDIIPIVLEQWSKANQFFNFPVLNSSDTINIKMKTVGNDADRISEEYGRKAENERILGKIENFLVMCNSKCKMIDCK